MVHVTPRSVDGLGTNARFAVPAGLAFDHEGNLYVADARDCVIRRITPSRQVTTLAGHAGECGYEDGAGSDARFAAPLGVAIDKHDNLYVTDRHNEAIRRISPDGVVSTLAGTVGRPGNVDGIGTAAAFNYPKGITIDDQDNLYVVADSAVRKIAPDLAVTTLAGHDSNAVLPDYEGYRDGAGTKARFHTPTGITVDGRGTLYVTDGGNELIREISASGIVSTFALQAPATHLNRLSYIAISPDGNLYVTGPENALVRRITPSGIVKAILTGGGDSDAAPAPAPPASFATGITLDAQGIIYVSVSGKGTDGEWEGAIQTVTTKGEIKTFSGSPMRVGTPK